MPENPALPLLRDLPRTLQSRHASVALRHGQPVSPARFLEDTGRAISALRSLGGGRRVLYSDDTYVAAVWLVAALCEGATVVMPGEITTATRERLARDGDSLIGDLPDSALRDWHDFPVAALPAQLDTRSRIVIHTSGSTGTPSEITKTLAQTEAEALAIECSVGASLADPDNAVLVAGSVPHQHMYGLSFRLVWPLAAGRTLLAHALPGPETLWSLPAGRRAVFISSPALLKRLPDTLDWPALPPLAGVVSAGSPLPREAALDAARKLGCMVTEIYGSSETGAVARRLGPDADWMPLPGARWQLGPDACMAWQATWLAEEFNGNRWFQSADRAEAVAGSFRLLGRTDRLAKIEDKRISLTAIEAALRALDDVAEARVIVLHGARDEVGAVLVLSEHGQAALAREGKGRFDRRLRTLLARTVEPLGLPRRWRHVAALPHNELGKTTEAALQECFDATTAPAGREWPRVLETHRDGDRQTLTLAIDADLIHFDGHFPQIPILPGVAQLDWALHFGAQCFELPPDCLRLEVVKFQQVIRPGQQVLLQLDWNPDKASLSFEYRSGEASEHRHASGRIALGTATDTGA
ncbi:ApeI family dehydratase [Uliginosibacterium sp. H1]|uniref:ApeI family dehydratase n=1 Tax=Uliginosibacterium sp. H1 TaxID=3114757 RepID=UPI002E16DE57|nr:AMP-binding protein [Uliginosibacterium sp. H1]